MSAYYANCGRCGTSFLTTTSARWMCNVCYNAERQEDIAQRSTYISNSATSESTGPLAWIGGMLFFWWVPTGMLSMLMYMANFAFKSSMLDYLAGCLAYASFMYPLYGTFILIFLCIGVITGDYSLFQKAVDDYITGIIE